MAGATIIESLKNIFRLNNDGFETEAEDYNGNQYGYDDSDGYEGEEESNTDKFGIKKFLSGNGQNNKVVQMPQQVKISMKIAKPTNFEQAEEIVKQLKAKNAVVMNLEYVSKDVARRIVDVVCGAVQALDGNMEKVSNSIFVVAPYNYDIISEFSKEKIENRFASSWIK